MTNPVLSPPLDEITTALLALLRGSGLMVFDGAFHGDGDGDGDNDADPINPPYPYGILYRIAGGDADPLPDLDDHADTVTVPYQVTAVGATRNQAEKAGRIFHDRLLGRSTGGWAYSPAMPAGWLLARRRPDPTVPDVVRAGDPPTVVFSQPARYLLTVVPA